MKLSSKSIKFGFNAVLLGGVFSFGLSFDNLFGIAPVKPTHKTGDIMLYLPFFGIAVALVFIHLAYKKLKAKESVKN
jgi:hypothetical protein